MTRLYVALLLTVGLAGGLCARAQEAVDPAAWAPADAVFYVGVTDSEKLHESFKKTAGYQMWNDPIARNANPYWGLVNTVMEQFQERVAKALDVPPSQLKNPLKGPICLFVTAPKGGNFEKLEPSFVARIGDKELMKTYYDAAVKKMREAADKYESVSAGASSIDVFTTEKKPEDGDKNGDDDGDDELDDLGDGNPLTMNEEQLKKFVSKQMDELFSGAALPPSLAMCVAGDRLVVATTADAVKAALRQEKGGDALSDSEDYKAMGRLFKPAGPIRLVVNVPRIIELGKKDDDESAKMTQALGLRGLRSIVAHADFAGEKYDGKLEAVALVSGERSGLLKILSMENRPLAPPSTIPASAVMAMTLNLSPIKVIDEVERIMRQIDPHQADQMRASMESVETPDGQTMNIRKDVLEKMKEPLTFNLAMARPYKVDSIRLLLSFGHKEKAAMDKLLGLLPPNMFTPRDVRGTQVYDFAMMNMSFAASNDQLLAGSTPAVESALSSGDADALASDADFKATAALAPQEAWGVFYVDSRRMMEAALGFADQRDQLEAAGMMNIGAAIVNGMLEPYDKQLKEGKLEDLRKTLRYQAPTIVTLSTIPEGIKMTQVTLKPRKE